MRPHFRTKTRTFTYLGKLVATTSVNNSTTATPFTLAPGSVLLLQADAALDTPRGWRGRM